jgi:hypothetical protein
MICVVDFWVIALCYDSAGGYQHFRNILPSSVGCFRTDCCKEKITGGVGETYLVMGFFIH